MSEAIARYAALLEKNPANALLRFSLAKAYYDLGDFTSAKTHFETALAQKPDWMVVEILLGKCHLSLGDRTAAKAAFLRARQLAIDQNHEGPKAEMDELLASLEESKSV